MGIIVITGQTATGKTSKALHLATTHNGEIVNFDSRQMYKKLNIVTGKYETPLSMFKKHNSIPIWLFDLIDPKEYFSSFDFKEKALIVIQDILKRKKEVILVGGTYFYLKHLLYGVESEQIPADLDLRNKLNKETVTSLQQTLKKIDQKQFDQLNESDQQNPQRLIRKIEIATHRKNNQPYQKKSPSLLELFPHTKMIGYKFMNRGKLVETITKRVEDRLEMGALKETQELLEQGYTPEDPGLKTIGYTQLIAYLKNEMSLEEAKKIWIFKEIQYAKRQLTFMKTDKNIHWNEIS